MNWRRFRRGFVALCCASLGTLAVASWFVGGALVAPANRRVADPILTLPTVATTLSSDSGSNIATWYVPVDNSQATVILVHPYRGNRRSMLGRAVLLHNAGYTVVMVDLQAHGESPGDHITVGFLERLDVRAAVDYARKTNPLHRIGIIGRSLGGAAALLASPLEIDALVLESVYPTIWEAVGNRVSMRTGPLSYILTPALLCQLQPRLGIRPADLRPIDHIADVGCPVLVASGRNDQHTTYAETQRLYSRAQPPKELVIFEGAAHTDLLAYNPKQYKNQILAFLNAQLLPSKTEGGREK